MPDWAAETIPALVPFVGAILASMLEPFQLTGCVLAGALIHNVWWSLLVTGGWSALLQKLIIQPRVEALHASYTADMFCAGVLAAWLTTAIVQLIARSPARARKDQPVSDDQ